MEEKISIRDLLEREPESVEYTPCGNLYNYAFCHVPEVQSYLDLDDGKIEKEKRIEIRMYKNFNYDFKRSWSLAGIFFDGKDVMITQNAGRYGGDYYKRFITNLDNYKEMVSYLYSRINVDYLIEENAKKDLSNYEYNDQDLIEFYDDSLLWKSRPHGYGF